MEQGQTFDMPSGAKLFVSLAPFGQAKALHDAVLGELRGKGVGSLDIQALRDALGGGDGAEARNLLMDKAMGLVSSKAVEQSLFACAEKAVYRPDGSEESSRKVSPALFDDAQIREQARADYYMICWSVAKANLQPFIKALFSALLAHVDRSAKSPELKSGPTKPQ